ncbi:MAG: hypothetical protein P8Y36_05050 [Alphaproteobacteria bacterium]
MFQGVIDADGKIAISFRDLEAAAFTLAEQFGSPAAGPTAWRLLREHIRGRGWQNIFSVWQNFPGRPGTQAVISPQENEVTIWASGQKPITMPLRNWQQHALDSWWRACLTHLQSYIPGQPDPNFIYQLVDIAKQEDQPEASTADATDTDDANSNVGWRILWATPPDTDPQSHSPYGPGGDIPCLQVFNNSGATITFGIDAVKLHEPGDKQGEILDADNASIIAKWEQCCRKSAAQTAATAITRTEKQEPANREASRTLTFTSQESEAFQLMKAMAETTPHRRVKWSVTRETPDTQCVMRVILDESGVVI